jgi:L-iditol 2-dehydrogenase
MRTVELAAPRRLELCDRPMPPDPGPGEVLVRMRAVGLCGSDLHWYQDGRVGHSKAVFPMVLGHEPVGEVMDVGVGVSTHQVGDRVAIEPSIVCGECEFCRSGRPNNCTRCVFMGGPQHPGFFRDYAVVPARNAEHFPDEFTYLQATLIEPVAVVVHVMELTPFRHNDSILVLGAGPIGLLTALVAKTRGAGHVFIADRIAHRLRIARQLGIDTCLDTRSEKVVDAVLQTTGGRGVDVVFDAAGDPETIQAGLAAARSSGQYVLIGIPSETALHVDLHTAMNKELSIQTVKRSNHKGHEAMELIAEGRIPDLLITHVQPIEQTPEAFELVSNYRDGVGKLVIEMGD